MLGLILLLEALVVAVGGPPASPEYLPVRVAADQGFFAREGLAVTIRALRTEPAAAEALARGQVDLAATSLEAALRFGPRQDARLVFGLTAAPPVALVAASGAASVGDLRGARVGLTSPGAAEHAWLLGLLERAGLGVVDLRLQSHGSRGVVRALERGDVEAALVREPAASELLAAGRVRLLADLRTPAGAAAAVGGPTVNAAVFARAAGRPGDRTLAAFARALLAAELHLAAGAEAPALYLVGGRVSAEQVERTIALVRARLPLTADVRIPRPAELLHLAPLDAALSPPAAR